MGVGCAEAEECEGTGVANYVVRGLEGGVW